MNYIKLFEEFQNDLSEDATLLRTLTAKSTMGFGKWGQLTVGNLIETKPDYLRWIYFNSSNINFTDDVIDGIGIPDSDKIKKPGKDSELGKKLESEIHKLLTWREKKNKDNDIKAIQRSKLAYAERIEKLTAKRAQGVNQGHKSGSDWRER